MKAPERGPSITLTAALPVSTVALAIGIFVVDTITNLEIAVAVLYVAVVLMSVGFCQKRGVISVSLGCMALTILSYFLTRGGSPEAGLINCGISLLAIAATTVLALKIESAQVAAHEARAQLAHVARVTTLGELTASIAHEINQPIAATIINGNASLRWLATEPPNLDEARNAVQRMIADANRAGNVIARVRSLAGKKPAQNEIVDLNEVVQDTISLIAKEIQNSRVSIHTQLSGDLPPILGDRIQLQQVVLNLALNAVEAMSEIDVRFRALLVSTRREGANGVLVSIHDSGRGLDSTNIDRLFDAFYTTKREGMGMGLAISRSIVEAHGGRIWAEANMPRGAVFQFVVPAVQDRE